VFFHAIIIENKYVCPELDETFELEIKNGRHPVIENNCQLVPYIPNDIS
jgi:DNA mismatch repair protein MutS